VISESESKEESKSKEEDNITRINKYLNQDLKELGLDRLNREDINESDAKIKVSKEFKNSKFFD
jgi:predicted transcriptional regulator